MSNNILRSSSSESDTASRAAAGIPSKGGEVDGQLLEQATATDAYHRSRLYSLISLALDRPGEDHEEVIESGVFAQHLQESARIYGDEDLSELATNVVEAYTDLSEHRHEWSSLFGVEEGVTVSQYELTYLPGPLMTTIRKLADISGFYEAYNMTIDESSRDRGDNIVFLTEFLGHLSLRAARLRDEGDRKGIEIVVESRSKFLEDHLGRWCWRFAQEVSKHDDGGFYAAVGELLAALVEYEIEQLGLDPKWVPDDPEVTEWNEGVFGDSGRDCGGCGGDPSGQGTHDLEATVERELSGYGPLEDDTSR